MSQLDQTANWRKRRRESFVLTPGPSPKERGDPTAIFPITP
jgi:hypothetical protein